MFIESWILQVSCKVNDARMLTLQKTWSIYDFGSLAKSTKYSWFHEQTKNEFIAYIYILL